MQVRIQWISFLIQTSQRSLLILRIKQYEKGTMLLYFATPQEIQSLQFPWTIDGLTVNITVHPRISLTSDNKQLKVKNVNRTDSHHKYRCQANNSVETITSDAASLNVQCEYDRRILRAYIIDWVFALFPPLIAV